MIPHGRGRVPVLLLWGAIVVFSAGTGTVFAQEYTITQSIFIPSVYYVGDQVELRLRIRTANPEKIVVPQEIPQPAWGQIGSLRVVARESEPELRIVFTSYQAGTRSLPSINLGPVVLEGINIFVSSLLASDGQNLSPPREQVLIPGTTGLLVLQVFILLVIPLLGIVAIVRGRPYLNRLLTRYKEGLPFRRIMRSLRTVAIEMEIVDARTFYIRLLDETRLYLADRLHIAAVSATTRELTRELEGRISDKNAVESLIRLFRRGDRVKFANEPASMQTRMEDLDSLEVDLRHIEHLEKLKRQSDRVVTADVRDSDEPDAKEERHDNL